MRSRNTHTIRLWMNTLNSWSGRIGQITSCFAASRWQRTKNAFHRQGVSVHWYHWLDTRLTRHRSRSERCSKISNTSSIGRFSILLMYLLRKIWRERSVVQGFLANLFRPNTRMEVDTTTATDTSVTGLPTFTLQKEKRKFNAKLYGRTIQKGFSKLHKDETLSDLTLIVGDEKIPVHRMVWNTKSPSPHFGNRLTLGVVCLVGDISSNAWKRISLDRSLTKGTRGHQT